jgi:hypothetical protein
MGDHAGLLELREAAHERGMRDSGDTPFELVGPARAPRQLDQDRDRPGAGDQARRQRSEGPEWGLAAGHAPAARAGTGCWEALRPTAVHKALVESASGFVTAAPRG